jgi:hypothetical protein
MPHPATGYHEGVRADVCARGSAWMRAYGCGPSWRSHRLDGQPDGDRILGQGKSRSVPTLARGCPPHDQLSASWEHRPGVSRGRRPRPPSIGAGLRMRVRRVGLGGEQAGAFSDGGRLHPGGGVEFAQDVGDVDAGGPWADEQGGRYLRVGLALAEQPQHVQLAGRSARTGEWPPARPAGPAGWVRLGQCGHGGPSPGSPSSGARAPTPDQRPSTARPLPLPACRGAQLARLRLAANGHSQRGAGSSAPPTARPRCSMPRGRSPLRHGRAQPARWPGQPGWRLPPGAG